MPKNKLPALWWNHLAHPIPVAAIQLLDPLCKGTLPAQLSEEARKAAMLAMDADGLNGLATWLKVDEHISMKYEFAVQWYDYFMNGGQWPIDLSSI